MVVLANMFNKYGCTLTYGFQRNIIITDMHVQLGSRKQVVTSVAKGFSNFSDPFSDCTYKTQVEINLATYSANSIGVSFFLFRAAGRQEDGHAYNGTPDPLDILMKLLPANM